MTLFRAYGAALQNNKIMAACPNSLLITQPGLPSLNQKDKTTINAGITSSAIRSRATPLQLGLSTVCRIDGLTVPVYGSCHRPVEVSAVYGYGVVKAVFYRILRP
jgi:hypothetical protein